MKVLARGRIGKLLSAEPGELVRLPWRGGLQLAIKATIAGNQSHALIFLGYKGDSRPLYVVPEQEQDVYNYGRDYEIRPDETTIQFGTQELWQESGCLLTVESYGWLMHVTRLDGWESEGPACYDFEKGQLVGEPTNAKVTMFSAWQLYGPKLLDEERRPEVYSFRREAK